MDNSNSESEVFLRNPLEFTEMFYNIGIPFSETTRAAKKDLCVNERSLETCTFSKHNCVWITSTTFAACRGLEFLYHDGIGLSSEASSFDVIYRTSNDTRSDSDYRAVSYVRTSGRYISWSRIAEETVLKAEQLPSHIVLFEEHVNELYLFLHGFGYSLESLFFYSHFGSSRHMLVVSSSIH
jgi:hypothetical protein